MFSLCTVSHDNEWLCVGQAVLRMARGRTSSVEWLCVGQAVLRMARGRTSSVEWLGAGQPIFSSRQRQESVSVLRPSVGFYGILSIVC
jgi:hypothetical protein